MKIDRLMAFGLNVGYMKTFKLKKKKKMSPYHCP